MARSDTAVDKLIISHLPHHRANRPVIWRILTAPLRKAGNGLLEWVDRIQGNPMALKAGSSVARPDRSADRAFQVNIRGYTVVLVLDAQGRWHTTTPEVPPYILGEAIEQARKLVKAQGR